MHEGIIKWKHFPRYWPLVRGIRPSPVNYPHKDQSRWALMFSLIYAWINGWENNREACDLRRHRTHYDVSVMIYWPPGKSYPGSILFHTPVFVMVTWMKLWPYDTYICVDVTCVASGNDLSSHRRQAMNWYEADILSTGPFWTNCDESFGFIEFKSIFDSKCI